MFMHYISKGNSSIFQPYYLVFEAPNLQKIHLFLVGGDTLKHGVPFLGLFSFSRLSDVSATNYTRMFLKMSGNTE